MDFVSHQLMILTIPQLLLLLHTVYRHPDKYRMRLRILSFVHCQAIDKNSQYNFTIIK